jgi:hypothetical protein
MRNLKRRVTCPQVADDCRHCRYRAHPLDRHWYCPGPRLWRRFSRRRFSRLRFSRRRFSRPRFLWRRVWRPRLLQRVRPRFLRWVWWLLSGLLWIWQFPILLLLLLIGYSWRPGTAQVWSEAKARPTGGILAINAPDFILCWLGPDTSARRCRPIVNQPH